jgi:hypothetical protein
MTQSRFNAFSLSPTDARHRGAATLAALALALVVDGCGGGDRLSKSQYEQHFRSDSNAIRKAIEPLAKQPSSLEELVGELEVGETQLRSAANDLDRVNPPKDIDKDNKTLVSSLHQIADELEAVRKAAKENDPQLLQKTIADLRSSHALVDVRDATNDMKKKGYKLETLPQ